MLIKYNIEINNEIVIKNLKRLTNQIYKLLPEREEGIDWKKPLDTIIIELMGMNQLLINYHDKMFPLLCKLEGLSLLIKEEDFQIFRRTIFECLNLLNVIKEDICQD